MLGDMNTRVRISETDFGDEVSIWIYQDVIGDIMGEHLKVAHPIVGGRLEWQRQERGVETVPTIKIPSFILKLIANALNEMHIKPDEESKIRGLYEASQKHLEDMRKLVFKEDTK